MANNTYRINGELVEATDEQEQAWQSFRDALSELADAYGVDYDGLAANDYVIEYAISDMLYVQ